MARRIVRPPKSTHRVGQRVQVDWWDGVPVDYDMKIEAWDSEVLAVL